MSAAPWTHAAAAERPPALTAARRWEAAAAWLALTAPGVLLPRLAVTLGLLAAPWLAPTLYVATAVRPIAAALLALHLGTTGAVLRWPGRWWTAALWTGALVVDGLLAGIAFGADPQVAAVGTVLLVLVAVMALVAAGWRGVVLGCCAALIGAAAALQYAVPPALAPPPRGFATTLSVEPAYAGTPLVGGPLRFSYASRLSVESSYAGVAVGGEAPLAFPGPLSVDTSYAGGPALTTSGHGLVAALAIVFVITGIGVAWDLLRVHRASVVVAAEIVAAGRVVT